MKIHIRQARLADSSELTELDHRVWPQGSQTTNDDWISRIETFQEGVIVAEINAKLVGVVVVELISDYDFSHPKTWYEITDNGKIRNTHCTGGKILYGVALSIDPEYQNSGIGTRLVLAVAKLVLIENVEQILLGARLMNYYKMNSDIDPSTYIMMATSERKSIDPELHFYKKFGFKMVKIIPEYFHDPDSRNFGLLISKKNPFYNKKIRHLLIPVARYVL